MCWISEDTLGISEIKCPHNDCRLKTAFLFNGGKVYVIDKKLLKKKSLINSLPLDLKEIIINTVIK